MAERKDSYMHFMIHEKHSVPQDKSTIQAHYINPQLHITSNRAQTGHQNPIFNHQKPFLAQVKTKAINGYKQTPYGNSNKKDGDDFHDEVNCRNKSNSFTLERYEKNKSKYDYLIYAQRQHQLEKQASKEIKRNQTSLEASRIQSSTSVEIKLLREENQCLQQKIKQLESDKNRYADLIRQKQGDIAQRDHILQQLLCELQKLKALAIDYKNLENNYNHLLMENHRAKDIQQYFDELNQKHSQALQHCSKLQAILQQKDRFLQQTIQSKEYQYHAAMNSKINEIASLTFRIQILETQNQKLILEIERSAVSKDKGGEADKFRSISSELETKINQVLDENGKLKNLISQKEGQIQQLNVRYDSLSKIVKAFQQRQSLQTDSKLLFQIECLKKQLVQEQQYYDRQRSQYELQILKLQNEIATRRYQSNGTLLDFMDRQRLLDKFSNLLKEVENLKQKFIEKH